MKTVSWAFIESFNLVKIRKERGKKVCEREREPTWLHGEAVAATQVKSAMRGCRVIFQYSRDTDPKPRGSSWHCGRTWTTLFLASSQSRKIIGVLATETTVGRRAYFSLNSLSKSSSLQTLAIATLRRIRPCHPSAKTCQFHLLLTLPLMC